MQGASLLRMLPAVLLTICAISCSRPSAQLPPDVILVSIDTLRADHVGCYGGRAGITPNIDWLASNGVRFERVFSAVPVTTPSHATMFTGCYPPRHGVRSNGGYAIPASVPTLPQLFSKAGYQTAGFVGAFPLDRQFGFSRGFNVYDDTIPPNPMTLNPYSAERNAQAVLDRALDWYSKERKPGRYFMFLHFYDPHYPYAPPEPFRTRFSSDLYSGEIAYVDEQLGRLLEILRRDRFFENGILVLTSDHGESLGEHGEATHMVFVYDATLRVPLILAGQSIPKGVALSQPACLVDLLPTLASLGKTGLPAVVNGIDLSPAWNGRNLPADRWFYSESFLPQIQYGWAPLQSVRRGQWKYILAPLEELYDTASDPGELKNLSDGQRKLDEQMRGLLQQARQTLSSQKADQASRQELDEETIKKLESLGYVSGGSGSLDVSDISKLPDPKTRIALFNRYEQALQVVSAGRANDAIAEFRAILQEYPGESWLYLSLARNLASQARHEEVLQILPPERIQSMPVDTRGPAIQLRIGALQGLDRWEETLKEWDALGAVQAQGKFEAERGKAQALLHLRRFQDALKIAEPLCKLNPPDRDALHTSGLALLAVGREDEGLSRLASWQAIKKNEAGGKADPQNDPLLVAGRFYIALGKPEQAAAVLRKLEQRGPADEAAVEAGFVLSGLPSGAQGPISGIFADSRNKASQGDYPGAARELETLVASGSTHFRVYYLLSVCYGRMQKWDDALAVLEKCTKSNPKFAPAYTDAGAIYEKVRSDPAKAESFYRTSIQLNPGFYPALLRLGILLTGQGRSDQAIEVLRRAVDNAPDQPEAYQRLALALKNAGKEQEASEVLAEGQQRQRKAAESSRE